MTETLRLILVRYGETGWNRAGAILRDEKDRWFLEQPNDTCPFAVTRFLTLASLPAIP